MVWLTWEKDCGELDDDAAAHTGQTTDTTGDAYEEYPQDHPEHDSLDGAKLLKIGGDLKDYGNKAFKAGDVRLGLDKYLKGLRYLRDFDSTDADKDVEREIRSIQFTLLSNAALAENKLQLYEDAKKSASEALALDVAGEKDKAKARFRKAQAEVGLKDEDAAIQDLEVAAKLAPGDPAISKELSVVKKKAQEQVRKEKAAFKKFFD